MIALVVVPAVAAFVLSGLIEVVNHLPDGTILVSFLTVVVPAVTAYALSD